MVSWHDNRTLNEDYSGLYRDDLVMVVDVAIAHELAYLISEQHNAGHAA
jgi:hypothetical protein